MSEGDKLRRKILSDMRVELTEEFDRNFERKAFFSDKWKQRARHNPKGSLLMVTGTMRRSIKSEVRGNGVRFSSAVPYASIHNEGGKGIVMVKAHTKHSKKGKAYQVRSHPRKFNMPQRQFIGDGKRTQELIKGVITDNLKGFDVQLTQVLKQ